MKKEFEEIKKSKYFKYIIAFGIIKKVILLILLLIPLVSFGQTYKEVMSINSADMFKKVVIENKYQYNSTLNNWITYGFNIEWDDNEGRNKSSRWAYYNLKDDRFNLNFSRTDLISSFFGSEPNNSENPYDLITETIKEKCKYYKIKNYKGTDYVTYSCSDSSYKGKIGFVIEEGWGIIRYFPEEEIPVLR